MANQILRAYARDRYSGTRRGRRAPALRLGLAGYLAAVGLVAAATAGVFFGTGYSLLLHPRAELHAGPQPDSGGQPSPPPEPAPAPRATIPEPAPASSVPAALAAAPAAPTPAAPTPAAPTPAAPKHAASTATPGSAPSGSARSGSARSGSAPSASAPQVPVQPAATPALSPAEIAALLHNGDASLRTGDIDSARLFYRHAANAGDAKGAIKLGTTFDPYLLPRGRVRNRYGDRTEARLWYLQALDLGAADAPRRLDRLAKETVR